MTTIQDFIKANDLTAEVEWAESNPFAQEGGWDRNATHWLVTIGHTYEYDEHDAEYDEGGHTLEVPFSQGSAIVGEPTLETVLDCLASDASSIEDIGFDEWASDMGYFPINSQREYQHAFKVYRAVKKQSKALRKLLGDNAYKTLIYDTERL